MIRGKRRRNESSDAAPEDEDEPGNGQPNQAKRKRNIPDEPDESDNENSEDEQEELECSQQPDFNVPKVRNLHVAYSVLDLETDFKHKTTSHHAGSRFCRCKHCPEAVLNSNI